MTVTFITLNVLTVPQFVLCVILNISLSFSTAGGSKWASGLAGVCCQWCRTCEASWILSSLQGDWSQHHSLQRSGHRWHYCHRGGPGSQHQHDSGVCCFLHNKMNFYLTLFIKIFNFGSPCWVQVLRSLTRFFTETENRVLRNVFLFSCCEAL